MIRRDITDELLTTAKMFPAVAILGPRQSGKTTLVQNIFPNHIYVSLEDLDMRLLANEDPRKFLKEYRNEFGVIVDEVRHAPGLLNYMQTIIDAEKKKGHFIITGSQNLLVNQAITQTLAGRLGILTLFPFSINELHHAKLLPNSMEEAIYKGSYPKVYTDSTTIPTRLYDAYIKGYIERDVRDIKNIYDLGTFKKFMEICAGRVGQVLNYTSLASDSDIDQKTAESWMSLLEAAYIVVLLQPYYKNIGKRLSKAPKLYFVDTGIACSLLNIKSAQEVSAHFAKGGLAESFIVSDFFEQYANIVQKPTLYFWRDYQGNEIDCVAERALSLYPIEIKSGHTVQRDFFKGFTYWEKVVNGPIENNFVIYGGDKNHSWSNARVLSWHNAGQLIKDIEEQKIKAD